VNRRKNPLQIRIHPSLEAPLKRLAKKNRRSITGEVHTLLSEIINLKGKN